MAKTQKILNLLAKTNAKPKEAAKSEKREKTFATTNIFYLCACSTFSVCVWSKLNWLDKTAITKQQKQHTIIRRIVWNILFLGKFWPKFYSKLGGGKGVIRRQHTLDIKTAVLTFTFLCVKIKSVLGSLGELGGGKESK